MRTSIYNNGFWFHLYSVDGRLWQDHHGDKWLLKGDFFYHEHGVMKAHRRLTK